MKKILSACAVLGLACGAIAARPMGDLPQHAVDAERLMVNIRDLPTRRAVMGSPTDWAGLQATERYVIARLEALGYEPLTQDLRFDPRVRMRVEPPRDTPEEPDAPTDDAGEAEPPGEPRRPIFRNIWIDLPGTDLPHEVLIVGAHIDAVPGSPGADDNGTGTSAVLELATVLRDRPMRRTVRLMFFNLEEVGLIGSTVYARSIKPTIDRGDEVIIGMMSLDMLGYFSDEPNSQRSPIRAIEGVFTPPTVADFIAIGGIAKHRQFSQRLNREMLEASPGLKTVVADFLPVAIPALLRSDHAPFLLWLDAPAVIVSDTADFRSAHYHRHTDTVDTIDVARFAGVVRGLAGAVYAIAEPASSE